MKMNSKPTENFQTLGKLTKINDVCSRIYQNQKDINSIKELQYLIYSTSPIIIKKLEPIIFSAFFPILKSISEHSSSFKQAEKQEIVDTFKCLFDKIIIDKLQLFFNIYGFLLFEIYDHKSHAVLDISEEYKLSIVECMASLAQCISSSVIDTLYVKENAPKLCQMIYVVLEIAKTEQLRNLRISAINCIMTIARVLDDNDFNDHVMRNQIAEMFLFFLPGVASQLKSVALIDEKYGHKVPVVALKAWGRIVTLLMQDYNASDQKINLKDADLCRQMGPELNKFNRNPWKDENELKEYLQKTQRSTAWYKQSDKNLQQIIVEFSKLTHHSHPNVRLELANMASLLIDNCIQTMPTSISHLIDIIIVLSEDDDVLVSNKCKNILENLSEQLTSIELKSLFDNLEEGFYNLITALPRKFNGIDEKVQIVALNSLIGYINLFGKHSLTRILNSTVHLNRLALSLIHISELDKSGISLFEEYAKPDYEFRKDLKMAWKKFRHFREVVTLNKIETVCSLLAKYGASSVIADFLLDIIVTDYDHRKEAIFLLNEVVTGIEANERNINLFKNLIFTYTDNNNWYLPISVMIDENGYEHTLSDVQNNIIQVCLLVEGIGKIAVCINTQFQQFLLKTLYLVLERAGSGHPLVSDAGSLSLSNISLGCGYSDITHLISSNIDYFSFHIERKLNKPSGNIGGLSVLTVVMRYSSEKVLHSTCEIIGELLMRTYDKNHRDRSAYLSAFKMFIQCLHRWLNIELVNEPFKTRQQKQEEYEDFKVSNIDYNEDFSNNTMDKTAEELYKEDVLKHKTQFDEQLNELNESQEEYKKPEPPIYIGLTVAILSKSLHCLASKNHTCKLLVLEILKDGLEVLKEWENELLPIVHQVWSPLVDRFKEIEDPVIFNYSFQLLVVLARLSKDFIRSRTAKDVLPNILIMLDKLSQESYLKDAGSAYRYTQNYKLQLTILGKLSHVITDLDMLQHDLDKTMGIILNYISDKQPIPLQRAALQFFLVLNRYDPDATKETLKSLLQYKNTTSEYEKNKEELKSLLGKCE